MSVDTPVPTSPPFQTYGRTEDKSLRHHRDIRGVLWTLIRTDFKIRYHGSVGGFVWALARPLTMFLVLTGVFSFIFQSEPNYLLGLVLGLFMYEFFSEGTTRGLQSLLVKAYLLTKTRFPFWVVVATSSVNAVIALAVFTVAILFYLAVVGIFPSPLRLGLFLGYVLQMWLIVFGFSLALSPLYLRYRDLDHLWGSIAQVGFFVAPVIFPLSMLPAHVQPFLFLWPPTPVIVYSREVLIGGTVPSLGAHLYLLAMTAVVLGLGALSFRRFTRDAAEQL